MKNSRTIRNVTCLAAKIRLRILAMFAVLLLAAGIAVFALDGGYEDYEIDSAPTLWADYNFYINDMDHEQIGEYVWDIYDYTNNVIERDEYTYGVDYYFEDYYNNQAGHQYNDDYIEIENGYIDDDYDDMYIGYAPEVIFEGYVHIDVDDRGNVIVDPYIPHGVVMDGDFLHIRLPVVVYADNLNIALPYGWSFTLGHETEEVDADFMTDEASPFMGRNAPVAPMQQTYTVITLTHTWDEGAFFGITPFAINAPWSFDIIPLPAPFDAAAMNNIINNNPGNLVISIPQHVNFAATITIPAGRHIIVTSQDTNLNGSVGYPILHTPPGTVFTINRTTTAGRHFFVGSNATLTLSHIVLDGGSPLPGTFRGGVQIQYFANLVMMAGSQIQNGRASFGGAVSVHHTSTFTMRNGTINNNYAESGGGIQLVNNGAALMNTFIMHNGVIHNNNGGTVGGGVFANGGLVIMNGGTIRNNTADAGGGMLFNSFLTNPHNEMNGGTIEYNRAYYGGGIHVSFGIFDMRGGTIRSNRYQPAPSTAVINEGGGLVVGSWGEFNMYGGTIGGTALADANHAVCGGGVWVGASSNFRMNPGLGNAMGRIVGNSAMGTAADQGGGGVFVAGNATFTFNAGTIDQNRAHRGGGVMMTGGNIIMTGGTILNNRNQSGTINPVLYGGGVHLTNVDSIFTMTGGTIGDPTAPAGNRDTGNRAGQGGGVWVGNGASFYMLPPASGGQGGRITSNLGTPSGGGVHVTDDESTFYMSAGTIDNNQAATGGGVSIRYEAEFHMSGGIVGNTAVGMGNLATSHGGGVQASHEGIFIMSGTSVIYNNIADTGVGGGIHLNGGYTIMYDGTIENNRANVTNPGLAGMGGGGIHLHNSGAWFEMHGGYIINNTTPLNGGGVWVGSSPDIRFTMTDGTISDNQSVNGGGVFVRYGAQFEMSGGHIFNNRETSTGAIITAGGGVYVTGRAAVGNGFVPSTFTMTGGTIGHPTQAQANRAIRGGGVWVGGGASFYMQDYVYIDGNNEEQTIPGTGLIAGNAATMISPSMGGGGVAVADNTSRFEMSAGVIEYNIGFDGAGVNVFGATFIMKTGGTTENPTHGIIRHNTSSNMGGAVYVVGNGGTFEMSAGVIEYNYAAGAGGVANIIDGNTTISGTAIIRNNTGTIHSGGIASSGILTMNGGTVTGNTSVTTAGGIEVAANVFTMNGGYIYNNTAGTYGGGVRVSAGTFTMTGGTIGGPRGCPDDCDDHAIPADCAPDLGNVALNGGGVWVGAGASFYMNPGTVTIDIDGTPTVIPTYGTIIGNIATETDILLAGGGGVFVINPDSSFTLTEGIIDANTAVNGGGVWVSHGAEFDMEGGIIRSNHATWSGGGVFVGGYDEETHFRMTGGVIGGDPDYDEGNTAENSGAGVLIIHNATFEMMDGVDENGNPTHGTIMGNVADLGGGGVHGTTDGYFIMSGNARLYRNHAGQFGGGVHLHNAPMTMNSGVIESNTSDNMAGGVMLVLADSRFDMRGGYIIRNSAAVLGGGVFVNTHSYFNMYGGTIGGLRGCDDDCDTCAPNDCIPDLGNTAAYGGGVFVFIDSVFNLRSTSAKTIMGNIVEFDGGGVWVHQDGIMRMETTALHPVVNNVHITHNTASRMGGGIFTERFEYACPLTRYPGAIGVLPADEAYNNLTLTTGVSFAYNQANRLWWPPSNRGLLTNIAFAAGATSQYQFIDIPADIRHPLNNYDINFMVDTYRFEFFKTDDALYGANPSINLVGGAEFRIFRNVNPEAVPPLGTTDAYLVQNFNTPGPIWEEVFFVNDIYTSPGTGSTTPLGFYMDPRHVYQLVEVMPPGGFARPMGQWRVSHDSDNAPNPFYVTPIGGMAIPMFLRSNIPSLTSANHPVTPTRYNLWYLGNWRPLDLPLTGGSGIAIVTMAGVAIIGISGLTAFILVNKKKRIKA